MIKKKKKEQKSCEIPEIQVLKPQNKPSRSVTAGDFSHKAHTVWVGLSPDHYKVKEKKNYFSFFKVTAYLAGLANIFPYYSLFGKERNLEAFFILSSSSRPRLYH